MADRFFVGCPLTFGPIKLEGPEAHHLVAVCRLRSGNHVYLFNGDGCQYLAEVQETTRRSVTLHVLTSEQPERELPFTLEVAAPLPKGDRAQFLVEKLTELGVTRFVPLHTARSVRHPRESHSERLDRYVIEASKQCGRNVLMEVASLMDWPVYAREPSSLGSILAHPGTKCSRFKLTTAANGNTPSLGWRVAVGPEGGLTEEEVALAHASGWQPIDLGPRILRIETAALLLSAWAIHER